MQKNMLVHFEVLLQIAKYVNFFKMNFTLQITKKKKNIPNLTKFLFVLFFLKSKKNKYILGNITTNVIDISITMVHNENFSK